MINELKKNKKKKKNRMSSIDLPQFFMRIFQLFSIEKLK